MSKARIEDLKVFPAVAAVIGEARAKTELFKLQGVYCRFSEHEDLGAAFDWELAPQGPAFWSDIYGGANPYDNQ